MDEDDFPLTFGKYQGESPNEISEHDPAYVVWLYENVTPNPVSRALMLACDAMKEDKEAERWGDTYHDHE